MIPPDVLPAWVAQMDFAPPTCIREAIKAQIDTVDRCEASCIME
ncbi:hypothetical protein BH24CHL4_BH24CHL4_18420 [soil metagenome]